MEPLITLIAVTALLLLAGHPGRVRGVTRLRGRPVAALRGGLAAMFVLTGIAHFAGMRAELVDMVPSAFPAPELLVTLSGIAELAGAAGLLWAPTARLAAGGLSLLLVVVFPANVHLAAGGDVPWYDELGPRTVTQIIFLAATLTVLFKHRRPADDTSPQPRVPLAR
ncbi:DoxX family membrane protein [Streptomyces triticagri]|uniref:DoxX family membrane protein n=1 Tax=Streptomyces triticagri TaxID=2293568 RepID=A0A372M0Q8_9ACTN|nr:DoxX family membrane protein [Streptomyces triticagri]RFU83867.1 DoxX family membrane protein [Streptomyces triticagri]